VRPRPGRVLDIELRWTPQRHVRVALALSAAGLVLCLLLAALGGRRRRDGAASRRQNEEDLVLGAGRPARVAATLVAGGVASAVAGVPTGLLVAALTALVMVTRRARPLLVAG